MTNDAKLLAYTLFLPHCDENAGPVYQNVSQDNLHMIIFLIRRECQGQGPKS